MNFDRPRWGEWIAALAGLWLILLVFRAWYEVPDIDAAVTAMDAFDFEHFVFILAGALGVLLLLLVAGERDDELSFPFGAVVAAAGLAATALAAYRIASPPEDGLDAALASYLSLLASLGVAAGGLIAAREEAPPAAAAAPAAETGDGGADAGDATFGGGTESGAYGAAPPTQDWSAPAGGGWSPAPPAPASTGWSPASAPAQPDPGRPIQAGDTVELTEGSVRFPAGTLGTVIETFGGGALIEVRDDAGNADRVEVPSDAYARPTAAAAPAADAPAGDWSPAMPAAAEGQQDWGFDEPGAGGAEPPSSAEPIDGPEAGEPEAGEKQGFFARLFRRKPKDGDGDGDSDETLAIDGPGVQSADAPADHAGDWDSPAASEEPDYPSGIADTTAPAVEAAAPEADAAALDAPAPEPADLPSDAQAAAAEADAAEPQALAEPEPVAEPEPMAEPSAAEPEPMAEPSAAEPEPAAADPVAGAVPEAAEPEPDPAPEPVAEPEPEPVAEPEPEPVAAAEPEPAGEPGPAAAAPDSELAADEPVAAAAPADAEPDPAPEPVAEGEPAAAAPDAPDADAGVPPAEEAAAPAKKKAAKKRRKSSASIKRPPEPPAGGKAPEIGDEVELQVSGGKWDAGTRGTVVDSFAAGVIVEVYGDDGKAERLDLPFEAVSIVEPS